MDRLVSAAALVRHGLRQLHELRTALLVPSRAERRDAVATVSLQFYLLASALRADEALPYFGPSARLALERLLKRLVALPAASERFPWSQMVPYLAFVSLMDEITGELRLAAANARKIVGVQVALLMDDEAHARRAEAAPPQPHALKSVPSWWRKSRRARSFSDIV